MSSPARCGRAVVAVDADPAATAEGERRGQARPPIARARRSREHSTGLRPGRLAPDFDEARTPSGELVVPYPATSIVSRGADAVVHVRRRGRVTRAKPRCVCRYDAGYGAAVADDSMDQGEVQRRLADALRLQYRSALLHATAAGVVGGFEGVLASDLLAEYATLELADVRRLADKLVALGGTPPPDVGTLPEVGSDLRTAVTTLVETDEEVIAALHRVIEPSGQEPRSEALEHLMEHVITRKQAQVDRLRRGLR